MDLHIDPDHKITAQHVVFATGYESQRYLKRRIGNLNSTYVLVSEPIDDFADWSERCMIWETARPYFYLRFTADQRIMIGGEDTSFSNDHRRDCLIERKAAALLKRFRARFPQIELEVAYTWAGTFGETGDGLPCIGPTNDMPRASFALGFGGNGITFSAIAAQIICDQYLERPNEDAALFRFDRPTVR